MKNIILVVVFTLNACASFTQNKQTSGSQIFDGNMSKLSSSGSVTKKYRRSIPIRFDLLLDEKITSNDPRIKTIAYVSGTKNYVVINYSNPNADKLARRIAKILTEDGVRVLTPKLVLENTVDIKTNKYVVVYIDYI